LSGYFGDITAELVVLPTKFHQSYERKDSLLTDGSTVV